MPPDLKIISVKKFTPEQHNAACGSCHAKVSPLTTVFPPGDRFFDHFDLVTLENPDYYPDGRDLGENYTYTSWLMSPCVKAGKLDCIKCHTASGRYRFKDEAKANDACLPCHAERVAKAAEHMHHPPDKPGAPTQCVSCHMPMTAFARMNRSDHSMLPPAPAATIEFGSPNACNSCHKDKDAAWADKKVRKWRTRDYQAPVLQRAGLIEAARKRDWQKLPEMLAYITSPDRDEVFAASLIRLTMAAPDERVRPTLLKAIQDPSPLVRAAAAEALSVRPGRESFQALVTATRRQLPAGAGQGRGLSGPISRRRGSRPGPGPGAESRRGIPGVPHGPAGPMDFPLQPGKLLSQPGGGQGSPGCLRHRPQN